MGKQPRIYSPVLKGEAPTKGALSADGRFALSLLSYHAYSVRARFPENTRGFLYYHIPSGQLPISGELRFRITPDSNPASFEEGYDLARADGFYWRVQLFKMPEELRNLALRDGLIIPSDVAERKRLVQGKRVNRIFLHYLEQPFFFDFASTQLKLTGVKDGNARKIAFYNPTREWRPRWCDPANGHGVATYKGMDIPLIINC